MVDLLLESLIVHDGLVVDFHMDDVLAQLAVLIWRIIL